MRDTPMRHALVVAAALGAFASSAGAQSRIDRSLYVLAIDRAPYVLDRNVRSPDSASAGSSRRSETGPRAGLSEPAAAAQCAELRRMEVGEVVRSSAAALQARQQQHEYETRELQRELEAWKRRAHTLESELRLSDATGRLHPRLPTPPAGVR